MRCNLWFDTLIYILLQSTQCSRIYCVLMNRVITALDCMYPFYAANISNLPLAQTWWRHQMETFSALLAICAGNSPVPGEFPTQRPVTRSFDVYFDLRPNKWLSKQSWFETLSCSLWRHRNEMVCSVALLVKLISTRVGHKTHHHSSRRTLMDASPLNNWRSKYLLLFSTTY